MTRLAMAIVLVLAGIAAAGQRPSLNLDGKWDFRFAPDDRGVTDKWFADGVAFDRQITVPGCWDAQGVGEPTDKMRHNAIGVGWHRRSLTVPDDWKGKHVWLRVGGVHRSARVYVNGQFVCEHIGYPAAFSADITSALRPNGEQSLVIAVDSRKDEKRDPLYGTFDVADYMELTWGGIFEHVSLEATGDGWMEDPFVRADAQLRGAMIDVDLAGKCDDATVTCDIGDAHTTLSTRAGHASGRIDLPNAPRWSPSHPSMLTADLTLKRGDDILDQRRVHFALRTFEARDGHFILNGDKIFLRGYGDDFTFPRELVPPADVEWWKGYLQKRKDFGFNAVRHHSMMPTESYLAAADEVGMLVQPELPIAYMEFQQRATPEARKLYPIVWERYIRQMRNHPSVMSWCMGNEQNDGLPFGQQLYDFAKRLDPLRPVIDSDGLPPHVDRPTLDYRSVQFDEHAMPWGPARGKYVNQRTNKPVVVHEMANFSCLPDPAEATLLDGAIKPFWLGQMQTAVKRQHLESRLPAMLAASQKLQASLIKLNMEAARLGPGVSGYDQWLFRDYWTQSSGIESIAGTTRALSAEMCRQFNADAVILLDRDRVNFTCGEEIPVKLVLSDFRPRESKPIDRITVRLGDQSIELTPPATSGKFRAPDLATPKKLKITAEGNDVHNEWPVWIWPTPPKIEPSGVIVTRQLTKQTLDQLEAGASVFMCSDDGKPLPSQVASFKPAWWKGDEKGDFVHGNLFLDHTALHDFPDDGYGDLQTFELLDHRPVVNLDDVPGNIEPIVWALDVPWKLRRMAYLFEARVGRGKLLVSTFALSVEDRAHNPAAGWMYTNLLSYAASDRFNPTAELPVEWLRARLSAVQ